MLPGSCYFVIHDSCWMPADMSTAKNFSKKFFSYKIGMKNFTRNGIFCSIIFGWLNIFHSLIFRCNSYRVVILEKRSIIKMAKSKSNASTIPAEKACVITDRVRAAVLRAFYIYRLSWSGKLPGLVFMGWKRLAFVLTVSSFLGFGSFGNPF